MFFLFPIFAFGQEKPPKKNEKQFRFEGTAIEGEREKPKDLYILSWKESRPIEPTPMDLEFLKTYRKVHDRYQVEKETTYINKIK